jgi:superfamily II DNA/RNA helicase
MLNGLSVDDYLESEEFLDEEEEDEEDNGRRKKKSSEKKRSFGGRRGQRRDDDEDVNIRGPSVTFKKPLLLFGQEAVFERKKTELVRALRLGRPATSETTTGRSASLRVPRRSIVFCNTIESCRKVENALRRMDRSSSSRRVLSYHSALQPRSRDEALQAFTDDDENLPPAALVCTDRASRGVDFGARPVDLVVLFDWPRDPAEFLRRLGRTARAGRAGYATILVHGRQLPMARDALATVNSGKPLNDLQLPKGLFDDDR